MSFALTRALARGMDAHQLIANCSIGWSYTYALDAAAGTSTTFRALPLQGEPTTGPGRGGANSCILTISGNVQSATNAANISFQWNSGIFGSSATLQTLITQSRSTNGFVCIPSIGLTGTANGVHSLVCQFWQVPVPGPAAAATATSGGGTLILFGNAINTGLPV